jgi:hypothetical protein
MFRIIIGVIVSIFMISLVRMILSAINREVGGGSSSKQAEGSRPSSGSKPASGPPPPNIQGGELRKCPTCSTYHAVSNIAGRTPSGEMVHFCSAACRDKFKAA